MQQKSSIPQWQVKTFKLLAIYNANKHKFHITVNIVVNMQVIRGITETIIMGSPFEAEFQIKLR